MKLTQLQCLNCDKSYTRYLSEINNRSSFCSLACGKQYRNLTIICQRCGIEFQVYRSELRKSKRRFCSKACATIDEIFASCAACNKTFKIYPSYIAIGRGKFCSQSCAGKHNRNFESSYDSPQERFFKSISLESHPNDCWIWTGLKNWGGYGRMRINSRDKVAHRYSWELHFGEIPSVLLICHRCDNRDCVNPDHLFKGTHKDNCQDMISKGRAAFQKFVSH